MLISIGKNVPAVRSLMKATTLIPIAIISVILVIRLCPVAVV